jgi:hypothetical protein
VDFIQPTQLCCFQLSLLLRLSAFSFFFPRSTAVELLHRYVGQEPMLQGTDAAGNRAVERGNWRKPTEPGTISFRHGNHCLSLRTPFHSFSLEKLHLVATTTFFASKPASEPRPNAWTRTRTTVLTYTKASDNSLTMLPLHVGDSHSDGTRLSGSMTHT